MLDSLAQGDRCRRLGGGRGPHLLVDFLVGRQAAFRGHAVDRRRQFLEEGDVPARDAALAALFGRAVPDPPR